MHHLQEVLVHRAGLTKDAVAEEYTRVSRQVFRSEGGHIQPTPEEIHD
jgi:hypothetical protein